MPPDRDLAAFEARAAGYEQGWLGRLHHEIADRTADLTLKAQPSPQRLLDVGCGTGYLLRPLASRCPEADGLAGVDPAPAMIEAATRFAEAQAATLRQSAWNEMNHLLSHEVERLQMLRLVNDHIRPQEIKMAQAQQRELATALQQSRLRLDALRLIWKGPPEALK